MILSVAIRSLPFFRNITLILTLCGPDDVEKGCERLRKGAIRYHVIGSEVQKGFAI